MKVDMSPKAIENRLKLVGELTKACLLLRQNSLGKGKKSVKRTGGDFSNQTDNKKIN